MRLPASVVLSVDGLAREHLKLAQADIHTFGRFIDGCYVTLVRHRRLSVFTIKRILEIVEGLGFEDVKLLLKVLLIDPSGHSYIGPYEALYYPLRQRWPNWHGELHWSKGFNEHSLGLEEWKRLKVGPVLIAPSKLYVEGRVHDITENVRRPLDAIDRYWHGEAQVIHKVVRADGHWHVVVMSSRAEYANLEPLLGGAIMTLSGRS